MSELRECLERRLRAEAALREVVLSGSVPARCPATCMDGGPVVTEVNNSRACSHCRWHAHGVPHGIRDCWLMWVDATEREAVREWAALIEEGD